MTRLLLAFFLFVAAPSPSAWAQVESGATPVEEHAEDDHHGGPLSIVFRWVNFIILFGGLGYLLKAPAAAFFAERRAGIQGGLSRARAAREEADNRMAGIERRLARLDAEVAQIQADAAASADQERQRILDLARREADRALSRSRSEVERIGRGLEQDVRAYLATRVVDRAERDLQDRMGASDRERTVRKVIREL